MSLGWIAYLPLPGLSMVPWLAQPDDRNARFHAWQGGVLVGFLWLTLVLLGLLSRASGGRGMELIVGALSLVTLLAYLVGALVGGISAARDRYVRIRPVYDFLAAVRR